MTAAYAAIAANAYPVRPWGVVALGNDKRKARPPRDSGKWRMRVGEDMRDMLATVVSNGTGRGARLPIPAYGKTGTSQEFRDAWFMGFAGNLVVGVWVGNDDYSPMGRVTGGSLPAQIWQRFLNEAQLLDPEFSTKLQMVSAFPSRTQVGQDEREIWSKSASVKAGRSVKARKRKWVAGYRQRAGADRRARSARNKARRSGSRSGRGARSGGRVRSSCMFWCFR